MEYLQQESSAQTFRTSGSGDEDKLRLTKSKTVRVFPTGEYKNSTDPNKGLYKLSNLDQTFPYPIEILFAFEKNSTNVDVVEVLKQSLGKVLEDYYPVVGKVVLAGDGRMVVDCDGGDGGGGVPFVEAVSGEEMAVAVGDITMIDQKLVRELVFSDHTPYETILDIPPLAIQVTTFKCGGTILGVRFNHALMDGKAFADFIISWSQVAKTSSSLSTHPHLDTSFLSPKQPQNLQITPHPEYSQSHAPLIPLLPTHKNHEQEEKITKSFLFTPTIFSRLRKEVNDDNNNNENNKNKPTDFELISALVWICWTKAKKVGPEKTCQIITAVDGRDRWEPPMPRSYLGNGIVWSCARSTARELTSGPLSYAVGIVHDAIQAVTDEYVRSAIDYFEMTRMPLEQENTFWITKWSRLPFYDVDFGWGEADQVAPGASINNIAITFSQGRKKSENIVVALMLPADEMNIFQQLMESELN